MMPSQPPQLYEAPIGPELLDLACLGTYFPLLKQAYIDLMCLLDVAHSHRDIAAFYWLSNQPLYREVVPGLRYTTSYTGLKQLVGHPALKMHAGGIEQLIGKASPLKADDRVTLLQILNQRMCTMFESPFS